VVLTIRPRCSAIFGSISWAQRVEAPERAFLVSPDQPRIAGHIRRQYRRQAAFDALRPRVHGRDAPAICESTIARERPALLLEHLAQRGEGEAKGSARHNAELASQPLSVEGSQLVEQYQSDLVSEPKWNAVGCGMAAGGHWGDRDGPEKIVQLWRRDNYARPGLLDFSTDGRI
jgi:hypothetical protein